MPNKKTKKGRKQRGKGLQANGRYASYEEYLQSPQYQHDLNRQTMYGDSSALESSKNVYLALAGKAYHNKDIENDTTHDNDPTDATSKWINNNISQPVNKFLKDTKLLSKTAGAVGTVLGGAPGGIVGGIVGAALNYQGYGRHRLSHSRGYGHNHSSFNCIKK